MHAWTSQQDKCLCENGVYMYIRKHIFSGNKGITPSKIKAEQRIASRFVSRRGRPNLIRHGTKTSCTHRIIVTNWLIVNSCGTRNFVLSSKGRSRSFVYRSTMTWRNNGRNTSHVCRCHGLFTTHSIQVQTQLGTHLTGIFEGNFALMPATSSLRLTANRKRINPVDMSLSKQTTINRVDFGS